MNFKSIIHSEKGKIIISILLGFGMATLFRKSCINSNGENTCIHYTSNKPDQTIYNYDNKCYTVEPVPAQCDDKPYAIIA